jgi:hypothetical protein
MISASQSPKGADPIELLRELYPKLDNGYKSKVEQAVNSIKDMQGELTDLKSTLSRQPLPEAGASLTAKVVDKNTQIEWLVTVREAARAKLLISAMPLINEWLAEQGLIAMDIYIDSRKAERGNAPAVAGSIPMCPDGHGAMKASTKVDGEFYCSHVVGNHPQTGKKLYCTHKAKG